MSHANHVHATIVIDVFRAFTTACYILRRHPKRYFITNECAAIERLHKKHVNAVLVGKPEVNSNVEYHIPNSPTRSLQVDFRKKTVLHRTQAGATGLLQALNTVSATSDRVFACSFVNIAATLRYLYSMNISSWSVVPMGHEANTPSLEDDLCADYLKARSKGDEFCIEGFKPQLQKTTGRYFFQEDQNQYPQCDFYSCLEVDRFDFAVEALNYDGCVELVPVSTIV